MVNIDISMTPTGLEPVLLVSKTNALPIKLRSLITPGDGTRTHIIWYQKPAPYH